MLVQETVSVPERCSSLPGLKIEAPEGPPAVQRRHHVSPGALHRPPGAEWVQPEGSMPFSWCAAPLTTCSAQVRGGMFL